MTATAITAYPLRWWSAAALGTLRERVATACTEWASPWGLRAGCLEAANASEVPRLATLPWQALNVNGLWLGGAERSLAEVLQADLFGEPVQPGSLAQEVAVRAATELVNTLSAVFGAQVPDVSPALPAPPEADARPWSGAVRMRLAWGRSGAEHWLHISPRLTVAHASLQSASTAKPGAFRGKLTPVLQAIGQEPLSFQVELLPAELSLGDLESLRVGDVLTLPHRLETPLTVRSNSGDGGHSSPLAPTCLAFLGARGGRRAIELLRTDTPHA